MHRSGGIRASPDRVGASHPSLIGVIYYLSRWDKPLDVHCSIPEHLLPGRLWKDEEGVEKEDSGSRIISPPEISDQEIREGDEKVVVVPNQLPSTPIQVHTSTPDPPLTNTRSYIIYPLEVSDQEIPEGDVEVDVLPNPITPVQVNTSSPDPALTRMQQFQAFRLSACKEYGTLFGLGYVFIGFPLKHFFRTIILMMVCETLGDKTLRVPTFYVPPLNETDTNIIDTAVCCISTVFGAIHRIAWSFQFASLQERWAWRISAILISALPICLYTLGELGIVFDNKANKTTWMNLYITLIKFGLETDSCGFISLHA